MAAAQLPCNSHPLGPGMVIMISLGTLVSYIFSHYQCPCLGRTPWHRLSFALKVFTWEINPESLFKLALPGLLAYRIYVLENAYHGITRECTNPREKYGMKLLWILSHVTLTRSTPDLVAGFPEKPRNCGMSWFGRVCLLPLRAVFPPPVTQRSGCWYFMEGFEQMNPAPVGPRKGSIAGSAGNQQGRSTGLAVSPPCSVVAGSQHT